MTDLAENQLHIILVNAVVEKDGRFLISQRSLNESHMPGWWSIPGGKVDRTEGGVDGVLVKTLKREIREEVNVEIEDDPVLVHNGTFIRSTGHHVVEFMFLCRWKSGEALPLEDTQAVAWVDPRDLDKYEMDQEMKRRIFQAVDLLKKQRNSEVGVF